MKSQSSIQWEHSHNFGIDNTLHQNKVKIVFWLTTVIMVLEIAAGTWSGSMALLADGWHMGTHSAAFLITLFAYAYAKKHANNKDFSFGTGKVNSLGGFASAIALAIVALMMVVESVLRLVEPHSIHFNEAIVVAIIGLVVNFASVFILHDDHHHHGHGHSHGGHDKHDDHQHCVHKHDEHKHDEHNEHSHDHDQANHSTKHPAKHQDHNMKAAYFHVLADTLTSLLAIVALLVGKYLGLIWMDPLMGIVGAVVIFRWSYGLIKESSEILLDKSVKNSTLEDISTALTADDIEIKDIHIWQIAPGHQAGIIKVASNNTVSPEDVENAMKKFVPELSHVSIEINN